ncbi:MAG: DUF421 domain-containing protein [Eubacterium sp.]|nr:DUF421 domain-containing protein [Eubacterium sp.]
MTVMLIRSVIIYLFLMLAVRIMGKRQVGELRPQELVITILISSVATIPLEEKAIPLSNSLIPILIFISLEIIESAISMKSLKFRNLIQGRPIFIIKGGKLQQKELSRLRLTVDDLLDALRQKDVFSIAEVENAVIETNGTITVQKKAEFTPPSTGELKIKTQKKSAPVPIVLDSKPITEYFGDNKITENTILLVVNALGVKLDEILLLTLDEDGKTYLIRKDKRR